MGTCQRWYGCRFVSSSHRSVWFNAEPLGEEKVCGDLYQKVGSICELSTIELECAFGLLATETSQSDSSIPKGNWGKKETKQKKNEGKRSAMHFLKVPASTTGNFRYIKTLFSSLDYARMPGRVRTTSWCRKRVPISPSRTEKTYGNESDKFGSHDCRIY